MYYYCQFFFVAVVVALTFDRRPDEKKFKCGNLTGAPFTGCQVNPSSKRSKLNQV